MTIHGIPKQLPQTSYASNIGDLPLPESKRPAIPLVSVMPLAPQNAAEQRIFDQANKLFGDYDMTTLFRKRSDRFDETEGSKPEPNYVHYKEHANRYVFDKKGNRYQEGFGVERYRDPADGSFHYRILKEESKQAFTYQDPKTHQRVEVKDGYHRRIVDLKLLGGQAEESVRNEYLTKDNFEKSGYFYTPERVEYREKKKLP